MRNIHITMTTTQQILKIIHVIVVIQCSVRRTQWTNHPAHMIVLQIQLIHMPTSNMLKQIMSCHLQPMVNTSYTLEQVCCCSEFMCALISLLFPVIVVIFIKCDMLHLVVYVFPSFILTLHPWTPYDMKHLRFHDCPHYTIMSLFNVIMSLLTRILRNFQEGHRPKIVSS